MFKGYPSEGVYYTQCTRVCTIVNSTYPSMSSEDEIPFYYTDGACVSNGSNNSRGACAYYLHDDCKKSWLDPTSPSTNQSAELGGILGAVRRAYHKSEWRIKIGTDSQYAINCFTRWRKKWRTNGWVTCQNETVKHKHLILKILKTMKSVKVRHSDDFS